MPGIKENDVEEIADKLRECLALIEPGLLVGSLRLRDAVDVASEDHQAFARAMIAYLGVDDLVEFANTMLQIAEKGKLT